VVPVDDTGVAEAAGVERLAARGRIEGRLGQPDGEAARVRRLSRLTALHPGVERQT
jgi:hypothetical protein